MSVHGVSCSAEVFHHEVNTVFHDMEARWYDQLHQSMWDSLPRQMQALAGDVLKCENLPNRELTLLDIGCGTGLATELLLGTELGHRISTICGVDTSPEMLRRYQKRAQRWRVRRAVFTSDLGQLAAPQDYDLIVTCSVLHHIPDLAAFLRHTTRLLRAGGFFLHLQDPNGDYLNDPELRERELDLKSREGSAPRHRRTSLVTRAVSRAWHGFRVNPVADYTRQTNKALMRKGILKTPLSALDLWTITDVHIYNNRGISIRSMAADYLSGYNLVRSRSYAFFGKLWSELTDDFRLKEDELQKQFAPNGRNISAVWRLI
jgi:2-polyprenyl-3-methyl-5-hydroxy-6-metoxy-1,4-benzoquinol methylase